jgi:hypothetical protein
MQFSENFYGGIFFLRIVVLSTNEFIQLCVKDIKIIYTQKKSVSSLTSDIELQQH